MKLFHFNVLAMSISLVSIGVYGQRGNVGAVVLNCVPLLLNTLLFVVNARHSK